VKKIIWSLGILGRFSIEIVHGPLLKHLLIAVEAFKSVLVVTMDD
jgi:hypothetical protein